MDRIRLLYVDAEGQPVERRVERLSEEFGFEVAIARSVEAGRAHVEEQPVDCVLAGLGLPEEGCLELLRRVRGAEPGLPFVLLAPETSGEIIERGLAAGATDYVPESVLDGSFGLLAHRLERAVGERVRVDSANGPDGGRTAATDGGADAGSSGELFDLVRRAVGADRTDATPDEGGGQAATRDDAGDATEFEWITVGSGETDFEWAAVDRGTETGGATPTAEAGADGTGTAAGVDSAEAGVENDSTDTDTGSDGTDTDTGTDDSGAGVGDGPNVLGKLLGGVDLKSEPAGDEPGPSAGRDHDSVSDGVTDPPGTDGGRVLPPADAAGPETPVADPSGELLDPSGELLDPSDRSGAGGDEGHESPVDRDEPRDESPVDRDEPGDGTDPPRSRGVGPGGLDLADLPREELLALLEETLDREAAAHRGDGRERPEDSGADAGEPAEREASPEDGGVETREPRRDHGESDVSAGTDPAGAVTDPPGEVASGDDSDGGSAADDETGEDAGRTGGDGPEEEVTDANGRGDGWDGSGTGAGSEPVGTESDSGTGGTVAEGLMEAVEYDRPEDLELEPGTSVLVQCGSQDDRAEAACTDLVGLDGSEGRNVLLIRYRQMDEARIAAIAEEAARTKIITVGYTQPVPQSVRDSVESVKINNPNDVTRLGIMVTSTIDDWASTPGETVVCYDPLDVLLRYKNVKSAFRFLHLFLGKLQSAGAVSHFHVDPSAGDPQEINTLKPLFDAVLTIDSVGTHVETQ